MKQCTKCKTKKPNGCFSKNSTSKDGLHSWCKVCDTAHQREYRKQPRVKKRACELQKKYRKAPGAKKRLANNRMKHRYNLTLKQYDKFFEQQNGVCAICGKPETAKHQSGCVARLAVDHNHKNKKVRGLLCRSCNFIIGYAKDSKEILLQAALYMEKYNG